MEERRILLRKDVTKLSVGVLGPRENRTHARVRSIQEAYLVTRNWMNERRKESGLRMGEVEGKMLNMMTDTSESSHSS